RNQRGDRNQRDGRNKRGDSHRKGERTQDKRDDSSKRKSPERKVEKLAPGLERFRIAVGNEHNIKADKIVEAVSNEAGLFVEDIGKVEIYDNHSTIVLPQGMPRDIFRALRKTWVSGHKLDIERIDSGGTQPPKKKRKGDGRDRK
ncbi:MAG: ATP-dependent helicase, partial [Thiotrichales bacterium]|nr:ATP-dependent helicase [Thiotrichales bacterium]